MTNSNPPFHQADESSDSPDSDTLPYNANLLTALPVVFSFDRYELIGEIGQGGMGIVYLARQVLENRDHRYRIIAIKIIHPKKINADTSSLFVEEAVTLAEICSDNVVRLFDFGTFKLENKGSIEEHPFIAMEYVDGVTLQDVISQLRDKGKSCPSDLAAAMIADVGRGLDAVHNLRDNNNKFRRTVHRDVTPNNIMVTRTGGVKILDLGVVQSGKPRATRAASALTAAYAAPELFSGEPSRQSDIFSLGLILHELITGHRVFDSRDTISHVGQMQSFTYEPPDHTPKWLQQQLCRMLEMDPRKRPATAAVLAETLRDNVSRSNPDMLRDEKRRQALIELGVQVDRPSRRLKQSFPYTTSKIETMGSGPTGSKSTLIPLREAGPKKHLINNTEILVVYLPRGMEEQNATPINIKCDTSSFEMHVTTLKTCVEVNLGPTEQTSRIYSSANGRSVLNYQCPLNTHGCFYVGDRLRNNLTPIHYYYASFQRSDTTRVVDIPDLLVSLTFDGRTDAAIVFRESAGRRSVRLWCVGVSQNG